MIRKSFKLAGASLTAISVALPAQAAPRGQNLQETPSAVSTISAEDIEQHSGMSAADALRRWCPTVAEPITVGSNGRVGTGAQFKKKAVGALTGLAGGLLGVGGGGGGRSSKPSTVRCKIKQKNMTVFTDPLTGIELQVGARRKGDNVEVFSRVKDSPDRGTFQTTYIERESSDLRTPIELGMCDIYGEFKLTVSWTKDTFVNGELVDHQEGGWSKLGNFKIPGMLSSDDAPSGYWNMLGFSNASAGARQIRTTYNLPEGSLNGQPTAFVVHVTQPKSDPVTTVPFTIMMEETDDGFVFTEPPAYCSEPATLADNAGPAINDDYADFNEIIGPGYNKGGVNYGIDGTAGGAVVGGGAGNPAPGAGLGAVQGADIAQPDAPQNVDIHDSLAALDEARANNRRAQLGQRPIIPATPEAIETPRDRLARQAAEAAAKAGFLSDEAAAKFGLTNARPPEPPVQPKPVKSILTEVNSTSPFDQANSPQPNEGGAKKMEPTTRGSAPIDFAQVISPEAAAELAAQGLLTPEAAKAFELESKNNAARDDKTDDLRSSFETRLQDGRTHELKQQTMQEFADLQGEVAAKINDFLVASDRYRSRYSYVASTSTELQGLMDDWKESKEIYENVDLAFAVFNLASGGAKIGFKGVKWFVKRRADRLATGAAKSVDEALAGAAASYEAKLADEQALWAEELAQAEKDLAEAIANGDDFLAEGLRASIKGRRASMPTSVDASRLTGAEKLAQHVNHDVLQQARDAGLDIDTLLARASAKLDEVVENDEILLIADDVDWIILRAIAEKKGWHVIPDNIAHQITVALFEGRQALAGIGEGVSPQHVEMLTKLKEVLAKRNIDFSEWLLTTAGELANGVEYFETVVTASGQQQKVARLGDVIEGIALYYDKADVELLSAIVESGGDVNKLRTLLSEVTQASLNGLSRSAGDAAAMAQGAGDAIGGAVGAHQAVSPLVTTAQLEDALFGAEEGGFIPAAVNLSFGDAPTRGQHAQTVLYGSGGLGEVGLGGYVNSFGVADETVFGELWDLVSEPVTTVASHRYTHAALDAYETLLDTSQSELIEMVLAYDEALAALESLGALLGEAGGGSLDGEAIASLQEARAAYVRILGEASPEWKAAHAADIAARIADIDGMIADLTESLEDLKGLASRVAQIKDWMEQLRVDQAGAPQPTTALFNPVAFVRAVSASLMLKSLASDAFGLATDSVVRFVEVKNPDGTKSMEHQVEYVRTDEEAVAEFDANAAKENHDGFDYQSKEERSAQVEEELKKIDPQFEDADAGGQ